MRSLARKLSLVAAIIGSGQLCAAEVTPRAGVVIEDLSYGQVLYEYYKQDYFSALTTLLVEEHFSRINEHATEAELLRGGLLLSYGLHSDAAEIFELLLGNDMAPTLVEDGKAVFAEQELRGRAWFFLGKVLFQRGYTSEAAEALRYSGDKLAAHQSAERDALLSQAYMELGELGKAEQIVDAWESVDDWGNYARYNLGVALVKANRVNEAAAYLDAVGTIKASSEEMLALRDRANLALGFVWLRQEDGVQAKVALERIRLAGPFSNSALLGYGWAEAAQGNYRGALVPWLELRDRKAIDPAFQESVLAIPYAYRQLGANQQAVESYTAAIQIYDDEIGRLDGAIVVARQGELMKQLLTEDISDFSRVSWSLSSLPDTAEARYLYEVIASNRFQSGLRNYRDLLMLASHLRDWQARLGIYGDIVDSRMAAYAIALERLPDGLYAEQIAAHRSTYEGVAETVSAAENSYGSAVFASAKESAVLQRIDALENSPEWTMASADAQEKLQLFKGVLSWDMDSDFKLQLWQQQGQLSELDTIIADSENTRARLVQRLTATPLLLEDYAERARMLAPQVEQLIDEVAVVSALQISELGEVAAEELADQRERLLQYRAQARFAQAAIFDSVAASTELAE